jgi:crossover junction endodeoxyribonuclease RusA
MRTVELTLPWPPSVNRIWRAVGGRILLSLLARQYHRRVANALPPGKVETLRGRLAVEVVLHPPGTLKNVRHDVMNREKAMCDALTKQRVWLDDSQIDEFHMMRGQPMGAGSAMMTITEIAPVDPGS